MKNILLLAAMFMLPLFSFAQVAPTWYITFDNASPLTPTVGTGNLDVHASAYSIGTSSGVVGKYLSRPFGSGMIDNQLPVTTSSFTWMAWVRPGYQFSLARNCMLFNFGYLFASLSYPDLLFHTSNGVGDDFYISFNGINKTSWYNLFDGGWHHLAFVYNATTGTKQVWIDGQLPAGFSKSVAGGSIPSDNGTTNYWNDGNCPLTCYVGDMDEVAAWINTALSDKQIYNNYLVSLAGAHYTTALYSGAVPGPQPITGAYSQYDFAKNTILPTPAGTQTSGATESAIAQLRDYALPRYKPIEAGSDSLLRMFSSADPIYLGGLLQSGVSNPALDGANISDELAYNFNWIYCMWNIGQGLYAGDTSTIQGKILKRFKANPRAKLQGWTFRPALTPYDKLPCDFSQGQIGYQNYYYLQNASGQPIDPYGNVTANKCPRPSYSLGQSYANFPDTAMKQNADTNKTAYNRISTVLGAGYNVFLNTENGEDFKRYLDQAMNADPVVKANRIAAGVNNITFQSEWRKRNTNYYSAGFLGSGTTTATDSCFYSEYQIQGNPNYFHQWAQMRYVQFPWRGQRLSTTDLYVRTPDQWLYARGANHGMRWAMDCQPDEFAAGDRLNSPFVSAGWDENECNNVRPAQWLGYMKCLGVMGAETYYPAMFSLYSTMNKNPHPKNYIWAMVTPSYAQAVTSRFEDILHGGYLMQGDMAQDPNDVSSVRSYEFNSGKRPTYTVVRKDSSAARYIIGTTINPNTNYSGGAPDTDTAHIVLASQDIKFTSRRQGSVFMYDNSVSPPIFYQLDAWHENSHFSWWTKDFNFEAEVNDNYAATAPPLKTYQATGAAAGDYRSFRTAISYSNAAVSFDSAHYYFTPRTPTTYYLWISMRSRTGNSTGLSLALDEANTQSISGVTDTNWFWYRRNGTAIISYSSVSAALHKFSLLAQNKYVEVDAILLTTDPNLIMPNNEGICGTVLANITPNGASVCNGSSTTFTANANTSYLWSTGATTQSISASSAGAYTVTVYDSFGCSGTSSVTLTVNANPSNPTISAGGPISFCNGGSVTLTSSAGTTHLWSTGATTQAISPTTAGTYRVTITNAAGCTASSATVTVNVNGKPSLASISPVTNTCPAVTFDLSTIVLVNTGTAGTSSYHSSQADAIANTNPIASTVNSTGTYWIRVTTDSSCYDYKSVGVVISNCACVSPPTADAGPDQSICSGSTATMAGVLGGSASVGTWTTSGTGTFSSSTNLSAVYTPSLADRVAGSVTITLTTNNPLGAPCAAATNIMILTINALPTAVIAASGATTFCSGSSVNLVATAGASYLWSNGATTQAINVTSAATYLCTITNAAGCTNTSNSIAVTVTSPPATPTITTGGSTTFCDGDSVSLTSSSVTGNTWSDGSTSQVIYAKYAGTYVVTVTNGGGCTAQSAGELVAVLQVPNTPTISTSKSPILCTGDSVTLTSSRTSGNTWSPDGQTTRSITVSTAGTYYVTVTNAVGCTAVSASVDVSYINCNTTCTTPTRLTAGQIGKKSANLGWDSTNVATDYIIFLKNTRTNVLTKISVQGTNHKWQVKNLDSGTAYQWYVQAVCGCCVFTDYSVKKYFTTK